MVPLPKMPLAGRQARFLRILEESEAELADLAASADVCACEHLLSCTLQICWRAGGARGECVGWGGGESK